MGAFSLPLTILVRVLLCGFLASLGKFWFLINFHSLPFMHPYPFTIQPSLLKKICGPIIQINFPFSNFHQGLTKTKMHSDFQQSTTWQQFNNCFLLCTTFPQSPSRMFYFFYSPKIQKILWPSKTFPPKSFFFFSPFSPSFVHVIVVPSCLPPSYLLFSP
jgi:hypothetical protein